MANDGQIVFEVTADGKHAIADIKDITAAIQKEAGKWDDAAKESTDNISNSFSGMLKNIASAISVAKIGQSLLNFGKEAVNAASDLEEVQNVVDTTFGAEGAAKIEAWAKNAGTQFGLTETKAKQFTSTLGAMMKSAGMSGDEIVTMSTDLAGLAADMASFYNLDFDTAFQKIRSGISGETEPLKQLGINMSVANLNAYALKKGLSETFDQMSQGEQTMLRYEYLLSATADAQGDFADTSDGFANSVRIMESNMQSLYTNVGTYLVPAVSWVVNSINSLFNSETDDGYSKRRTVLDDIADIDANTLATIENINATQEVVNELATSLEEIAGKKTTLDEATKNVGSAVTGVSSLAEQLSHVKFEEGSKQAFESTLSILYNNVESLSKITGEDADGVRDWLNGVAEEASKLDPNDAAAWASLMGSLFQEIPGLSDTEEGQTLIEQLTQYYLSLGNESEEAAQGLAALGYGTDEIEEKQSAWLKTCRELVSVMPGLADIIDTNTGEVKGGISAVKEYADEWARVAKYEAEIEGLAQKKEVVSGLKTETEYETNAMSSRATAKAYLKAYGGLSDTQAEAVLNGAKTLAQYSLAGTNADDIGRIGYGELANSTWRAYQQFYGGEVGGVGDVEVVKQADDALKQYIEDEYTLAEFYEVQPKLVEEYDNAIAELTEQTGKSKEELEAEADAANEAKNSMTTLEKAANGDADAIKTVTDAVTEANTALTALADHVEDVRTSVRNAIDDTISGFDKIDYTSSSAYGSVSDLTEQLVGLEVGSDAYNDIQSKIDKYNETLKNRDDMYTALQTQSNFIDSYIDVMTKAQNMGLSDELLASLSDGSVDSYQYLLALTSTDYSSDHTASEIDELYKEIQTKKDSLTSTLTDQQLTVDQVYQQLLEDAKTAVEGLDLEEEASENSGKTIDGIASGIKSHVGEVAEAVDAILAELDRLNSYGITLDFGSSGTIEVFSPNQLTNGIGGSSSSTPNAIASYDVGTDYVPYDGIALLHQGEAVLTAEENKVWQSYRNSTSGFDYDTMGSVMSDNVKAGGNVYLNGRVVGSVISEEQGKSYRSLQRSGWQA